MPFEIGEWAFGIFQPGNRSETLEVNVLEEINALSGRGKHVLSNLLKILALAEVGKQLVLNSAAQKKARHDSGVGFGGDDEVGIIPSRVIGARIINIPKRGP